MFTNERMWLSGPIVVKGEVIFLAAPADDEIARKKDEKYFRTL